MFSFLAKAAILFFQPLAVGCYLKYFFPRSGKMQEDIPNATLGFIFPCSAFFVCLFEGQQSYLVAMTVLSVLFRKNVHTQSIPTICCSSCDQQMCASESIRCS